GNVYIVGTSRSPTFPGINAGSIQAANAGRDDVILTKISPLDFIPTRAGSCAVLTACRQPGTYPCCTSEPTCTCRHEITDDADCTAGGKTATGCSITVK
ncbi:MAG TPA: hypothetical protein VLX28_20180, partial [Thermoanaerobaculia bacterium]|nr:hypothetical protein [Thermoanaerobaculia bacterium]